ncbi:Protein-glucosylgalactosylhydroxylysine glucosidase [Mactra antiquata]
MCFTIMKIVILMLWMLMIKSGIRTLADSTCVGIKHESPWSSIHFSGDDYSNWRLCSNEPPDDDKRWPSIGNGHIATVVHSDTVYMNGLYNGNGSTSTRARIPAYISFGVNISKENIRSSYCLNMDSGMYVETHTSQHWSLEIKMYAHRTLSRILVTQLTLTADGNQSYLDVSLIKNQGGPSKDIKFEPIDTETGIQNISHVFGVTKEAETPETGRTDVHVYYNDIPSNIWIETGTSTMIQQTYLMSVSPNKTEARLYFYKAMSMVSTNTLESTHISDWNKLWDAGRIDIYGNQFLARLTYSSLYYIYSALPTVKESTWPFYGLSPADLAHNGYNGHMFWDQDTWMFPPILMLNPNVAKSIVNARIRALKFAKQNAQRTGYKGARYPWESAMSGLEVTPAGYDSGPNEQHISGDVALAFRQYLMVTRDCEVLTSGNMKAAIFDIAEFWKSRVSFDEERDLYEIFGVMPPDEYQAKVNNSVYTNYIAQKALQLPAYVCSLTDCESPADYEEIAKKMYIPYDTNLNYHPEYDGYNTSNIVKQADVILLGWPLGMKMADNIRRNDLQTYEKVTPGGPAMSWGMFTIGWLEIGEYDKANETFYRQQLNRRDPFNIWTENTDGYLGVTNFITGMGGYLHSLIFGYGGVRIQDDGLLINCAKLPDTSGFRLKEVDYLGGVFDIDCDATKTRITLLRGNTNMYISIKTETHSLAINKPFCATRQPITIRGTVDKCTTVAHNRGNTVSTITLCFVVFLTLLLHLA